MKKLLSIALFFVSLSFQAQIAVALRDKATNEAVRYANIWKAETIYATSDSLGIFYVRDEDAIADFKVSAIGFKTENFRIDGEKTVYLNAAVVKLKDISIAKKRNSRKIKLGKAAKGDYGVVCSMESLVPMMAKYFPNSSTDALYLDELKFKAFASTKNRIAAVSVFTVGADGKPDVPINSENIICRFKKGLHIASVDLKPMHIAFPENGIFVVFNFLQLEQNREYSPNSNTWFFYEPMLESSDTDAPDTWSFGKDGWKQNVTTLEMQLILTD